MVLLAAFQVLLGRWSGREDVAVGTPVANRPRAELDGLVGFFVNTLVMRGDLSGAPSFEEFLGRVRAGALEAFQHQDLPFERLVEELAPERDLSRTPLFQAFFVLQNTDEASTVWRLPGVEVEPVELATSVANFDLAMWVRESADGGLSVRLEYATDLFDTSTTERIAGNYATLLADAPPDRVHRSPPWNC